MPTDDTTNPSPETTPGDAPQDVMHHESPRMKRGMTPAKMQLNLTSMIDVIFQLLIYFVVTASFTVNEGILITKLPQEGAGQASASAKPEPPKRPLNIVVSSVVPNGYRITIEGYPEAPANFKALQDTLIGLQFDQERGRSGMYEPDNPVIIKPDGQVRWQHVVNAFNAALAARYSNVSFAQAR
jgi:biopolymer transport protein ExbD